MYFEIGKFPLTSQLRVEKKDYDGRLVSLNVSLNEL